MAPSRRRSSASWLKVGLGSTSLAVSKLWTDSGCCDLCRGPWCTSKNVFLTVEGIQASMNRFQLLAGKPYHILQAQFQLLLDTLVILCLCLSFMPYRSWRARWGFSRAMNNGATRPSQQTRPSEKWSSQRPIVLQHARWRIFPFAANFAENGSACSKQTSTN